MKKLLSFLLCIIVIFTMVTPALAAPSVVTNGTCGNNLTWTLDSEGTLTISGTGAMYEYSYEFDRNSELGDLYNDYTPWDRYTNSIKKVVINDGVTSIGSYAFYYCSSLTSVTIPDSVTYIGRHSFYYCKNLTSITIPDSVTFINDYAFYCCYKLKTATIPNSVTYIGDYAFYYCSSLKTATIPNSVTSIGDYAFYYCNSLESVTIGDSVTSIGDHAFYCCYKLKTATIPNSVTSIGNYAFYYCSSLKTATIPNSVTSIGDYAFSDCNSLESVTIGDSVTYIGCCAFDDCDSLEYAFYEGTRVQWDKINIRYDNTNLTDVIVIEFYDRGTCGKSLKWTMADESTITISGEGKMNNYSPNDSAPWLHYHSSIKKIIVESSVTSIGSYAFSDCNSLESVTIGDSVTSIGDYAFAWCENLTNITIPDSVTSIGNYSFYYCDNLASVTIGDSVTYIGSYAFYGCDSLEHTFYEYTRAQWDKINIGYGNTNLTNVLVATATTAKITTQPKSATAASGASARTTVKAVGDGLTYTWYAKDKGDTKFYKSSAYKTATYSVVMNDTRDGRQVYCVVTDKYGNSVKTNTVTLSIEHYAKITNQPKSVTVEAGKTATVKIGATGDGLKYYWYFKNPGASKFTYTSSFTGNTYSVALAANRSGRQVYCYVVDQYGNSVKSDTVTLTVGNFAKITTQPANAAATDGASARTTVKATGDGLTYTWYAKDVGDSKFYKSSAYKTATYSVTMTDARNGRQVYCVVTDKYGNSVTSNTVTLSMKHYAKITTQPKSVMVSAGLKATVTVGATGDGLTYKWYFKNPGAAKFSYTSSFTGNTYSVALAANRSGRQVYCVVTDKYGNSVKSETVTLSVGNVAKITSQPTSVTVTAGTKATVKVTAIGDGLTYKWYFKNPGATKFSYTSTFTGNTYSVALAANRSGRQVYCVVTDQYGNSVKSNTVTLYTK